MKAGLITIVRVLIGAFFIIAAGGKIYDSQGFADHVAAFQVFPAPLITPLAIGLPWWELTLGICLTLNWQVRPASIFASLLLVLFQIVLASALYRSLNVSCGCSTMALLDLGPKLALIRNVFLFAGLAWIFYTSRKNQRIST